MRLAETKSTAGRRTIPLPKFAIKMPQKRRHLPYFGEQTVSATSHARNQACVVEYAFRTL
jgi:hypothetical protein